MQFRTGRCWCMHSTMVCAAVGRPVQRGGGGGVQWVRLHPPFGGENVLFFFVIEVGDVRRYPYPRTPLSGKLTYKNFKGKKSVRVPPPPPPLKFFQDLCNFRGWRRTCVKKSAPPPPPPPPLFKKLLTPGLAPGPCPGLCALFHGIRLWPGAKLH